MTGYDLIITIIGRNMRELTVEFYGHDPTGDYWYIRYGFVAVARVWKRWDGRVFLSFFPFPGDIALDSAKFLLGGFAKAIEVAEQAQST